MNNHELWQAVLGELELTLSKANFTTWFKHTFISTFEGEHIAIGVPNAFTKTWLEKKYNIEIAKSLQKLSGTKIKDVVYRVEFRPHSQQITPASTSQKSVEIPVNTAINQPIVDGRLNPNYTFETFVVGKGSEFAHAAALAVAENPGTKYNPLFIYGGVGLGKTHIAQAVGNAILKKHPKTKILYATSERFTNEFIHAIKHGKGKEFKDAYRTVDLLLIDDIQFLSGKDGTMEEFFHTFNTLHANNKQIVLTSDRAPKQIPALEHRLTSRFECGMMADISSPDFETRIAILETKCKERNYELDADTVRFIATVIQSNVRELEGALNKVIAYHQFKNLRPNLESAKSLLSGFSATQSKKNVTPKHVIQTVSSYFDVSIEDLVGKCREKRFAFPRQIIMYLLREEVQSSFPSIGHELGGRDHTTAMHANDKIRTELENNQKLRQDIDLIKQRIYNT